MKRPHKGQNSSARPPGKRRRPLLLSPEVYITLICEYKQEQERKNPGKKWDGRMPRPYSVDMYNGIRVNVGEWLCGQRLKYAKRIKDNNKEESWTEKRLREIGVRLRTKIKSEEYIGLLIEYIKEQERKHPGVKWNGSVPYRYSAKLEDGIEATVGKWLLAQKRKRTERINHNIFEESPEEKKLNELGYAWNSRNHDVEFYIEMLLRYKLKWETNNPGVEWDGKIPLDHLVEGRDGTIANLGRWVSAQRVQRKKRIRDNITEVSLLERRLDAIGIEWKGLDRYSRMIMSDEYLEVLLAHKKKEEMKHPGKPWNGHGPREATLADGKKANMHDWCAKQRCRRKNRINNNIKEIPELEAQLTKMGFCWTKRKVTDQDYVDLLLAHKKKMEMEHPGKPWNGMVRKRHIITLDDGVKARLGDWVTRQRRKRKLRISKKITEVPPFETWLTEIGFSWAPERKKIQCKPFRKKRVMLEDYMGILLEYKKNEEKKHGKPWDGNVPDAYSVMLADGRLARLGQWVCSRKSLRRCRIRDNITEVSISDQRIEQRLTKAGFNWEKQKVGRKFKKRKEESSEEEEEESSEEEEEESSEEEEEEESSEEEEEESSEEEESESERGDDDDSPWDLRTIESFTIASRKLESEDYTELRLYDL